MQQARLADLQLLQVPLDATPQHSSSNPATSNTFWQLQMLVSGQGKSGWWQRPLQAAATRVGGSAGRRGGSGLSCGWTNMRLTPEPALGEPDHPTGSLPWVTAPQPDPRLLCHSYPPEFCLQRKLNQILSTISWCRPELPSQIAPTNATHAPTLIQLHWFPSRGPSPFCSLPLQIATCLASNPNSLCQRYGTTAAWGRAFWLKILMCDQR